MVSYRYENGETFINEIVLILIVVEDGLVLFNDCHVSDLDLNLVLILIVVEDGLVLTISLDCEPFVCLNPYCSGRWSRTLPF